MLFIFQSSPVGISLFLFFKFLILSLSFFLSLSPPLSLSLSLSLPKSCSADFNNYLENYSWPYCCLLHCHIVALNRPLKPADGAWTIRSLVVQCRWSPFEVQFLYTTVRSRKNGLLMQVATISVAALATTETISHLHQTTPFQGRCKARFYSAVYTQATHETILLIYW